MLANLAPEYIRFYCIHHNVDIQSSSNKEYQTMKKINTGKALLGGIVAAVIIDLIEGVVNGVVLKADWAAAMTALGKSGVVTDGVMDIYNIVVLKEGIIAVWLSPGESLEMSGDVIDSNSAVGLLEG